MTTRRTAVLVGCLAVLAVFAVFTEHSPSASAREIVEGCRGNKDGSNTCYENVVPNLFPRMTLSEIFTLIREIRREDPTYQFCHVLAHKLGERVVAEDPERWIEAMALNPSDGLCSNGFIHGVIGGKFRAEVLDESALERFLPDFSRACEPHDTWKPSLLDQAICYHGMGHLYVYITDADLPKALSLCERTTKNATGDFSRVCIEGVFMQIYQPLEPDDFLMIERMPIKPTKVTVRAFCATYERDEYEGACLRESWPYFRDELLQGGAQSFCSGQPNLTEETACYESAFSILGRQTLGAPERALTACAKAPEPRKNECYARVAMAYLEENRSDANTAISFCERAPEGYSAPCTEFLVQRASFIFGESPALQRFCRALPVSNKSACGPAKATWESTSVHTGTVHIP